MFSEVLVAERGYENDRLYLITLSQGTCVIDGSCLPRNREGARFFSVL